MTKPADPIRGSASPDSPADHLPGFCAPEARKYILGAAILGSSLAFIDGSVVALALPAMRETLQASLPQAQWISNGYMLPLAALILLGGALGDRFGLARCFGWGIGLFVAASVFCAAAPTPPSLIAARVLQGIGAAVMIPQSLALIARAYPEAERGRAIGIWAAASAVTTALGPIIGGLALSFGGPEMWRAVFAVNVPLGALAVWLLMGKVRGDKTSGEARLDAPGALLATLALGLLAFGLTGAEHGEAVRLLPITAGAVALAAFLLVERASDHPMVPLRLFANPVFSTANALTFLVYFALTTIMFFLPMTVITGWGVPEISAAAAFAPISVFMALNASRAGRFADRHGAHGPVALGASLVALSFAGLALFIPSQDFWGRILPCTALMGLGMSFIVSPLSTAIMAAVPAERTGTASGINNAVSRMAGLIAVAAMGSVLGIAYAALGGPSSFGTEAGGATHVAAMNGAFALVAWITAALATIGAILSWTLLRPQSIGVSALR